jgi:secondary thiamine-phosphate synthase enzyme
MISLGIQTQAHQEFHEITSEIEAVVARSGVESGHVIVYVPHTTAGITINEQCRPGGAQGYARRFGTDGAVGTALLPAQ